MKKLFANEVDEVDELMRFVRSSKFYVAILIKREPYSKDKYGESSWKEELYWKLEKGDWVYTLWDSQPVAIQNLGEDKFKVSDKNVRERLKNIGDKEEVYLLKEGGRLNVCTIKVGTSPLLMRQQMTHRSGISEETKKNEEITLKKYHFWQKIFCKKSSKDSTLSEEDSDHSGGMRGCSSCST